MSTRLNFHAVAPEASKAVTALEQYCQNSGLPKRLIHLMKLRASIINGCAYCVDMHTRPLMSWRKRSKEVMRIPLLIAGAVASAVAMTAVFAQSESNSIRCWTTEIVNERDPFTNSGNTP